MPVNRPIHERLKAIPMSTDERKVAIDILSSGTVCVATLQRRMRIGWDRAADIIVEIKGASVLPDVAKIFR